MSTARVKGSFKVLDGPTFGRFNTLIQKRLHIGKWLDPKNAEHFTTFTARVYVPESEDHTPGIALSMSNAASPGIFTIVPISEVHDLIDMLIDFVSEAPPHLELAKQIQQVYHTHSQMSSTVINKLVSEVKVEAPPKAKAKKGLLNPNQPPADVASDILSGDNLLDG